MGNQTSRSGDYRPRYPPKQAYYSDRGTRRKYGRSSRPYRSNEDGYDEGQYMRYPGGYPYFNPSLAQQPFAYAPAPPPPMAFAAPTQQVAYPVIPPMPVPAQTIVIPNAVQMPQHTMMQMPVPQPASSSAPHVANNPPVIPPIPQNGAGTPFPTAAGPPVIPATPTPFPQPQYRRERSPSSSDSSSEDIPSGPAIQPGQYGLRNIVFDRPESIVFHHHPLPPPPKDVFELSPYIGLLESLHRPPEETLVRNRSGTYPPAAGYVISPVGSHASREKKQRKGLFRGLSERLKGKKRDRDEPTMVLPVMFTAPPGAVQPDTSHIYGPPHMDPAFATPAGQPGMTPGPMFVPPSPSRTHTPVPQPPPKGPPSPAPSHRSRVYSPRQQYQPLKIDLASELAGLTHLSPHLVHFLGKLYPTAFHALEAQRFTETRPDVAEQIRTCESPDQVRAVVSHHSAMGRHDWEQVVLQMMDQVLHEKFIQHPDLRRLLLGTGDVPLQFSAQQDNFWGDGPLGQGANQLGKALQRVRDRLRSEGYTAET